MYILSVDQGGTKTAAAVCDHHGAILGAGVSGGACHQSSGMGKAMDMVDEACSAALSHAGLLYKDIDLLFGGLTGIDWEDEVELVAGAIKNKTGLTRVMVCNDVLPAFKAGTKLGYGCGICAGTAANVAAISKEKDCYCFNFFCNMPHIGKLGLQSVFDSYVGLVEESVLEQEALRYFRVDSINTLKKKMVNSAIPAKKVRNFAPIVISSSDSGDATARSVVANFTKACAHYAATALKKYGLLSETADVVLTGGIFKARSSFLWGSLRQEVFEKAPLAVIREAEWEPVVGGLLYGLEAQGLDIGSEDIQKNLKITIGALSLRRF